MIRMTTILVIALTAATLGAQDFGGEVTQDPRAGLAIYDFHFNGPPMGQFALFTSLGLGPQPIHLGPLGAIYLDPAFFPVSPFMPLDPKGQGALRLVLPWQLTNDHMFCFQAVFIDNQAALRVPPRLVVGFQEAFG